MKTTEQTQRSGRGSILDLVLVFLLVLSATGIFLRWQDLRGRAAVQSTEEYRLGGTVRAVDPAFLACAREGDSLYTEAGEYYGRLDRIEERPCRILLFSDGAACHGEWDRQEAIDVYVEILFDGSKRQGRVLQNGMHAVMVGQELRLFSRYAGFRIAVESIAPKPD